jgi:ubiquinone/menaquinone biosynthesis C-methylase UbiE
MTRMVRKFFAANRAICKKIAPYLPQTTFSYVDINELYEKVVAQYMNSRADQTVVDVGGGKSCAFAEYRDPTQKAKIIAVDISEEELKHNTEVDEKRVVDVVQGLPFDAEEVDLIVSHSVLEHLERTDEFVVNSKVTLKKGGYFIHLFPCKFAPFALINQALPHALSRKVVYFFKPETKGICGFPAFYNDCYYSGISKVLKEHDFEIVDVHLSYYQSPYFNFFAPLYLVNALYEALIYALGVKNLCAYLLIIARKK